MRISFGDNVRFIDNELTRGVGLALKEGTCTGHTTPSITNVEFLGDSEEDFAICIELSESEKTVWTVEELLEFIDHGEGQVIEVGNTRATRMPHGSWKEEIIDPSKEKKNWLKKLFGIK